MRLVQFAMKLLKNSPFLSGYFTRWIFGLVLVCVCCFSTEIKAEGFRGIPLCFHVKSVDFIFGEISNTVQVCYESISTIPYINEEYYLEQQNSWLASHTTYIDKTGEPVFGEQPDGIEILYRVYNYFTLRGHINADRYSLHPGQFKYYSRFVRFNNNGVSRNIKKVSENISYEGLFFPHYDIVTYCETIEFEGAYSESYIRSLFESPFTVGQVEGESRFLLNVASLPFGLLDEINEELNPSLYVVPIFGLNADLAQNILVIQAAHYMNSIIFLEENMDEKQINSLRSENSDLIEEFEAIYGISVPEVITVEDIIDIFIQLKDLLG